MTTIIKYILTGSPKAFGFKTKESFRSRLTENFQEARSLKEANLLITDSMESDTNKMKTAHNLGIAIETYGDLAYDLGLANAE